MYGRTNDAGKLGSDHAENESKYYVCARDCSIFIFRFGLAVQTKTHVIDNCNEPAIVDSLAVNRSHALIGVPHYAIHGHLIAAAAGHGFKDMTPRKV